MAMTEHAYAYEETYFEQRRLRVLTGAAAKDKANTHRSDVVKVVMAVFIVLGYFLIATFMAGNINLLSAEINSVKADIVDKQNDALKADLVIGQLSSLERIEAYAVDELGMVAPAASEVYYLNEESSVQIAQGQAALMVAAEEATQPEEENSFLRSVSAMVSGYFGKTALAAEEE